MKRSAQAERSKKFQGLSRRAATAGKNCLRLFTDSLKMAREVNLQAMAGNLAFTTVLSIAPLLAVLFYVFKVFGGLEYAYEKLMPFLLDNLSEGTGEIVEEHLANFIRQVHAKAVGWAGIAGLLVTSIMAYSNIVGNFNRIWEIHRPRSIRHRAARAATLLVVGPVLVTASIAITTAVAARVKSIPFSGQLAALALSTVLFSLVYALVPMVKVPAKVVAIGSLLPAALFEAAKYGYAIYTKRMVSYSAFYGSFAAIPLFLLWIYIGWTVTLFGAVWVRTLQLRHEQTGRLV